MTSDNPRNLHKWRQGIEFESYPPQTTWPNAVSSKTLMEIHADNMIANIISDLSKSITALFGILIMKVDNTIAGPVIEIIVGIRLE